MALLGDARSPRGHGDAGRPALVPQARLPAAVAEQAFRNSAMVRVSGGNVILSPPLVIQRPEIDIIVDALEAALQTCGA